MKKTRADRAARAAVLLLGCVLLAAGCTSGSEKASDTLFEKVSPAASNVDFSNDLTFSNTFNVFTYTDFYGGGGVALGDVNGDSLLDVYLVANQEENRLYLNKGDFTFEDVTEETGTAGTKRWSTGASMVDVNGDGLLDIYVSNAGAPRNARRKAARYQNELFINNGDLTFTERAAEYGINDGGNSIHAAFFDYDNDGDLDVYVLNNHNSQSIGSYNLQESQRDERDYWGGDRLYRNEAISDSTGTERSAGSAPQFTEVTEQAGLFSSEIGFGLGVSAGDLNRDGWMDLYVSNDFFERDYLYLNNQDGTFDEVLREHLSSTSTSSMGGDIADLNNDGWPELFVTDMLPKSEKRMKTMADFVGWEQFQAEVEMGYFHKYLRNTLQLNNGNGSFSEIGRYAGVEATDWSWGALMADFDMDGRRDIFVANGVYKDETNKDFLVATTTRSFRQKIVTNNKIDYGKLLEMLPTTPVPNAIFEHRAGMRFANRASAWGMDQPSFSTGAAYGDLDGDGDLDLVVNNVNSKSFVYRNNAAERHPARAWIEVRLEGQPPNTYGVGAQVEVVSDSQRWYAEQMPQRGFQSSMDPTLQVGLGAGVATIDTLRVRWPGGRTSLRTNVATGQRLVVAEAEALDEDPGDARESAPSWEGRGAPLLTEVAAEVGLDWTHEEPRHNDFEQAPLLFHMRSTEGPPLCSEDVDGDGREDVFVGGGRGQAGALFVQGGNEPFTQVPQPALDADREAEDTACEFFDSNGDGTPELYVGSGSSEFPSGSPPLADRVYRVEAGGTLARAAGVLPTPAGGPVPTGTVRAADVDGDGDQDLFVGRRMGDVYGVPVGGFLLENDGAGAFEEATRQRAPQLRAEALQAAGVTDAAWGDLDGDGAPDLVVAGEWMPLTVFFNRDGRLERAEPQAVGLEGTRGWWKSLTLADLDDDGALDLVAGNHGLNSRFRAGPKQPMRMWVGDFGRDGRLEQILASYNDGEGPYPVALRQHMIQQLPYLKSKYPTFEDYAETTVPEMFGREQLEAAHAYRAEQMASVVGWNGGAGHFQVDALPLQAQLAPMYGVLAEDLSADGTREILMGGNLQNAKPQAGAYDASHGAVLQSTGGRRYRGMPTKKSGFRSPGEIRSVQSLEYEGRPLILVARSGNALQAFRAAPGRRE